jgi:hypothetical protein
VSASNLCGYVDDNSSRAPSDSVVLVVAAVDGLLESGSDADVSDNC